MVENVNIWGTKQQNRGQKLQYWASNPEIAEIFHSSAKFFFWVRSCFFPQTPKNPAGILTSVSSDECN